MYVDEAGIDNRQEYEYGYCEVGKCFHALKSGKRSERVRWIAALKQSQLFAPNELNNKFAKIARFPGLGRQRDEILPGLRSLPIDVYLILYMPLRQEVDILRVVSGYRNLTALFSGSDD